MRLICPNCTAQYEVDATMIPDEGRDVQCSNCGHTWYELAPQAKEALAPDAAPDVDPEPWETPEVEADGDPEIAPGPELEPEPEFEPASEIMSEAPEPEVEEPWEAEREPEPTPEPEDDEDDDDQDDSWDWPETRLLSPAEDPDTPVGAKLSNMRRPADVAALDLLREEAEREISRRKPSTTSSLEVQTDFSLDAPAEEETPSRALKARMARLNTRDALAEAEDEYVEPRRELLPDMDEINSTLRPGGDRDTRHARSPDEELLHRKGFRIGFVASVGIAAVMVIAYAWAPSIASALPPTEGALISYVDVANSARDALDTLFGGGA